MHRRTVVEGVMGGTIGAVAIAVWFLCIDVSMGQPFRTPALLGATLFEGLRDPTALHPTARVVLEYTLVHWVAFVAFGLVAAGLLAAADRDPRLLFVVFMLFCCFEVFALGLISVLAEWLFRFSCCPREVESVVFRTLNALLAHSFPDFFCEALERPVRRGVLASEQRHGQERRTGT